MSLRIYNISLDSTKVWESFCSNFFDVSMWRPRLFFLLLNVLSPTLMCRSLISMFLQTKRLIVVLNTISLLGGWRSTRTVKMIYHCQNTIHNIKYWVYLQYILEISDVHLIGAILQYFRHVWCKLCKKQTFHIHWYWFIF